MADLRQLDLKILKVPRPDASSRWCAEAAVSNRDERRMAAKEAFWGRLARLVDLTGKGSLVKHRPPSLMLDLGPLERADRLEERVQKLQERLDLKAILDESKMRESRMWLRVSEMIKEITPQFILRNVPRAERNVELRRLSYTWVIWRDYEADDLEESRRPRLEPIPYLASFALEWMEELANERHRSLYSFDWSDHARDWTYKVLPSATPNFYERKPVKVQDLSLEPYPPKRAGKEDQTRKILDLLARRTDGSA